MVVVRDEPQFAGDLYRDAAGDSERFRLGYPSAMLDHLLDRVQPSGGGWLMDLACGTGQLTFALGPRFAGVWAVDQEPDMIHMVGAKAAAAGWHDLRQIVSAAEDLDAPPEEFELVTIGNAFHRLPRDVVAGRAFGWLQPGGHLALCWSDGPLRGGLDWQLALGETVERWQAELGVGDRVPPDWQSARQQRPDRAVLAQAGFRVLDRHTFMAEQRWTVETLTGYLYATSILPRAVIGGRSPAFEADIARHLEGHLRDGNLTQTISFAYELAQRPRAAP
jgi:ubiquinone/menaquinone biosynthesis C-methylase UbiE